MKEVPLSQGKVAIVDDEDYERVMAVGPWSAVNNDSRCYARKSRVRQGLPTLHMSRFVFNAPDGVDVDHVDGNGLDNRKSNLRLATRTQNNANQAKQSRETSSQYKGVSWDKARELWFAKTKMAGKTVNLGRYPTEEEAARAYDASALELWGEFARLNFPLRYTKKVVVVTGARKGVGRMCVDHFLAEGATVIGLSRGGASLEHPRYTHVSIDISNAQRDREVFSEILRQHGKLDILVNAAAVATSTYAYIMPVAGAQEMAQTNLLGAFYVCREAGKIMRRNKWGRIVNVGSIHAKMAPVGASLYAATKAAQETLVQVLSKEMAPDGITVNTLALSPIETDMLRASGTPETIQKVIDGLTIPRLTEPEDVFAGLDFFLSEGANFYTGQTLLLGGVHQ